MNVDVTQKGAIILGKYVTCDGFQFGSPIRIQTHTHGDHLSDFETSKGYQTIITSEVTKELLILRYNAELSCRSNLKSVPFDKKIETEGIEIELLSSGHMIGATQVAVSGDGLRTGYSGDFSWPLERVIQVDNLVVDSTYGNPNSVRRYSREEVNERFIELVLRETKKRPVQIKAHPGTLQYALELLDGVLSFPIIACQRVIQEADIYRKYGYSISQIYDYNSADAKEIIEGDRYLRLYCHGEAFPFDQTNMVSIVISAFMTGPENPVVSYSEHAFRVALSGHADFNGTLEYVAATSAKEVVTDNSRGGHGVELAIEINNRLGVKARPSSNSYDPHWGR